MIKGLVEKDQINSNQSESRIWYNPVIVLTIETYMTRIPVDLSLNRVEGIIMIDHSIAFYKVYHKIIDIGRGTVQCNPIIFFYL